MTEDGKWNSEVGPAVVLLGWTMARQDAEVGKKQKSEARSQKPEGRGQRAEDRSQRADER